jgi:hypothetical protein
MRLGLDAAIAGQLVSALQRPLRNAAQHGHRTMLRQCRAPAFDTTKPSSTRRNDIRLVSKISAGLANKHMTFLGWFLFSNPISNPHFNPTVTW